MKQQTDTHQSIWKYWAAVLSIVAALVSVVAIVLALRADVVELGALSGSPQLDAYRAQVEELQRANDRILNTAWSVIGAMVALATILVTFNFIRSDRVVDQERSLVQERFDNSLGGFREELTSKTNQIETSVDSLRKENDETLRTIRQSQEKLDDAIQSEVRKRAEVEFFLFQLQSEMLNLAHDITSSGGPFLPFRYTRLYGPFPTGISALDAAIESQEPKLIDQALNQILYAVRGPIPEGSLSLLDSLYRKVSRLPNNYDPVRHQVLEAVLERIHERDKLLGRDPATNQQDPG